MSKREEYNECVSERLKGKQFDKEERKIQFCMAAKLCSDKAKTEDEARKLCNVPKLPKWAKDSLKDKEEEKISCADRMKRVLNNLEVIQLKVREGEAEEVKPMAAQLVRDIHICRKDDEDIINLANEIMSQFNELSKGYYLKGEAKEFYRNVDLLKGVLL